MVNKENNKYKKCIIFQQKNVQSQTIALSFSLPLK